MKELIKIFEKRRDELAKLQKLSGNELGIIRNHQIDGAIAELDIVLKTLHEYEEKNEQELKLKRR